MRGALFFSLKDNVSYEETGTKYKRDREYAGLWVSGDSFCRFTAVYAEQAGDDRKCKIFVFPEYYAGAGGFCGAGCAVAEDPGRTDNETDVFMLLYLVSAIFSYGISPCREDVLLGYPGWYMGLVTLLSAQ